MIRRLLASATRFEAELAKRLFAKKLVFQRERAPFYLGLAYTRIDDGRRCRGQRPPAARYREPL